jgi:hypothetical protein
LCAIGYKVRIIHGTGNTQIEGVVIIGELLFLVGDLQGESVKFG